jgi:hypothetical protein
VALILACIQPLQICGRVHFNNESAAPRQRLRGGIVGGVGAVSIAKEDYQRIRLGRLDYLDLPVTAAIDHADR